MRISFLFILILLITSCKEESTLNKEKEVKNTFLDIKTPDEQYPVLFEEIQNARVFPDSKTFVDCVAKSDAATILKAYNTEKVEKGFDLKKFVAEHFESPISISSDFQSDPTKSAEEHVRSLWPVLTRAADKKNERSTLISLPNSYVVPGGRFREVYYWDSYFTMLGMIEHGELELAEDILDNFAYLLETVGHIPNGNRAYYKTRSQPPFFSQMVKIFAKAKGDEAFNKYHKALKTEHNFWVKEGTRLPYEHSVNTDIGVLNRYYDRGTTPRQESYKEDFELVQESKAGSKMYVDLRAGAESGWDYSSRWFSDGKNMSTIETTDILPVDLNALLYGLEEILVELEPKDSEYGKMLKANMKRRKRFVAEKCTAEDGTIEDYNWVRRKRTGIKSLAMIYPLFFEMVSQQQADVVAKYIQEHFLKPGGVVTSLNYTGQQWDAPNGWAPLQWMCIMGLEKYGHTELAKEVGTRWVALNEKVYENTGKFVEKYNVEDLSLEAGGGEYPVQDGFGWSNGVYVAIKAYLKTKNN
ncbi:UNVERIFIED_CONTAM: hypothetical protein GTU68_037115 [Idotea baltica]|nr:hypothetical protein [Idotea baltica]